MPIALTKVEKDDQGTTAIEAVRGCFPNDIRAETTCASLECLPRKDSTGGREAQKAAVTLQENRVLSKDSEYKGVFVCLCRGVSLYRNSADVSRSTEMFLDISTLVAARSGVGVLPQICLYATRLSE